MAEADLRDLRSSGVDDDTTTSSSPGLLPGSVRIATVDNYQGEEADVVVASLVRSNLSGSVGFLCEPERINVLVSRARHGMVLIGNADCLRNASHPEARLHWRRLLDKLQHDGCMYTGLPAICQQHSRPILPHLSTPQSFLQQAPDGGCCLPCNAVLRCGHLCPRRCHAYDREHVAVRCEELVQDRCEEGHLVLRRCCDEHAVCGTCVRIGRLREEERRHMDQLVGVAAIGGVGPYTSHASLLRLPATGKRAMGTGTAWVLGKCLG
jgi:hypothetical protein